jgi:hypothetical protein
VRIGGGGRTRVTRMEPVGRRREVRFSLMPLIMHYKGHFPKKDN